MDTRRAPEPWAVLTGDSLFVGDIARPDLAVDEEEGARAMFHSLRERLLALGPDTEIWPGHLGGSMCGGPAMDQKVSSTIGFELRHNPLLSETDELRFVERALADLGPQPPNHRGIAAMNAGPLLTGGVRAAALSARRVGRLRDEGAMIVDVRAELQFAEAHIPGAVLVTALRPGFGTAIAWIHEPGQSIVFVGRDDGDGLRATRLAAAVGVREVAGYLGGGMTSWREERRPVARMERLSVPELIERRRVDPALQILDVREAAEYARVRIPGAVHAAYHDLHGVPDGLDPARPLAVVCASGRRSAIGASLMMRLGAARVAHVVDGGVGTWASLGGPVVRDRAAG